MYVIIPFMVMYCSCSYTVDGLKLVMYGFVQLIHGLMPSVSYTVHCLIPFMILSYTVHGNILLFRGHID